MVLNLYIQLHHARSVNLDNLEIRLITELNATHILLFYSHSNTKHSIAYVKIGKHCVKIILHNTGSDECPTLCNMLNYAPKNFLQLESIFTLSPFLDCKCTPMIWH